MVCSNLELAIICHFGKRPWVSVVTVINVINAMIFCEKQVQFDLNTSSERPLSKSSENHKINIIGPTELKLQPLKDALCACIGHIQEC